jgi:hypothetical protein
MEHNGRADEGAARRNYRLAVQHAGVGLLILHAFVQQHLALEADWLRQVLS